MNAGYSTAGPVRRPGPACGRRPVYWEASRLIAETMQHWASRPHRNHKIHETHEKSLSCVSWFINILWLLPIILSLTFIASCTKLHRPLLEEIAQYDTKGWAHDVNLDGDFLYVSDRQGGFAVFDRSKGWSAPGISVPVKDVISLAPNSGRPVLAARYEGLVLLSPQGTVASSIVLGDIANAVVTRGDLAFGAYGANGLVIAQVGEADLQWIAQLKTPGWSHDVKLWGNRAFLADWNYGLRVVDVSRPESPMEVGVLPSQATAICVALQESQGKTIAAVAEGHAGVSLVEFDAPGRPTRLSRHPLGLNPADAPHPETGGWAHGVALCGNYMFVANWKRGLAVLDISDRLRPRLTAELPTHGTSLGVKAEAAPDGTILVFLADGEAGLRVFRMH
jgi:hypothetical protein